MKITFFLCLSAFCIICSHSDGAESDTIINSKIGEIVVPHFMESASTFSKFSEKIKPDSGMMVAVVVMGISFMPQLNRIDITNDLNGALFFDGHNKLQWSLLGTEKNYTGNSPRQESKKGVYSKTIGSKVLLTSSKNILKVPVGLIFSELSDLKNSESDIEAAVFPEKFLIAYPDFVNDISKKYLTDSISAKSGKLKDFLLQCRKITMVLSEGNGTVSLQTDFLPAADSKFADLLLAEYKQETSITFKQLLKIFNNSTEADFNADSLQKLFALAKEKKMNKFVKKCISNLTGDYSANPERLRIIFQLCPEGENR